MKRVVYLSILCAVMLSANQTVELGVIKVEGKFTTKVVKDVSLEELKSADLSEALMKNTPSIMLLRRSGVSNDISLRGMKKDNINVIIDGAKVYGGCSNRMDPPISHVLTNNIERVTIQEGPFDVENFGTLGGLVDIKLKTPKKEFNSEINLNTGSFKYKKASVMVNGGTDKLKFLLSMSKEDSEQYKDGDSNTLFDQNAKIDSSLNGNKYQSKYKDMEAYEKKTLLSKLYYDINDNHSLNFAYTANRSENVLFANTRMDAKDIDSDIYTLNYEALNLGRYSSIFNIDTYYSKVNHPMTSLYRNKAVMMGESISDTYSKIKGLKIKNAFYINNGFLTFGLDTSKRTWTYDFYSNGVKTGGWDDEYETINQAIFAKYNKNIGKLNFDLGARYDSTNLKYDEFDVDKNITSLSINAFLIYKSDLDTKYFFGLGKSVRVPDYKEMIMGNNNYSLDETENYEVDLGFEKNIGNFSVKTKVFYSILKDYVYRNSIDGNIGYENLDAKIYGLELSGYYFFNDELTLDYAVAYKRGRKDDTSATQEDRDLADISPLRANIGLNYEKGVHTFNTTVLLSDKWNDIDEQYAEQDIDSYAVLNLKYNNQINKSLDVTLGVDNIFDVTYAVSNTYADIGIADSFTGEKTMINEPGRYIYVNLRYRF